MATTALARRFAVDVTTDLTLAGGWNRFPGMTDFNPQITPNKQDSSTYDSDGWSSMEITMQAWSLTLKALRQPSAGVFPPAQEQVRACQGEFGDAARTGVRWYDKNGAPEAYQGVAIVEWNESKTAVADLNEVQVSLTGDGVLSKIANPGNAAAAPVVLSATPSAVGAGGLVEIIGTGFTGTVTGTGVKIGGVSASSFIVVSDSVIAAVLPSGSAGSAPIIVTNAVGASNALPYTRGA